MPRVLSVEQGDRREIDPDKIKDRKLEPVVVELVNSETCGEQETATRSILVRRVWLGNERQYRTLLQVPAMPIQECEPGK